MVTAPYPSRSSKRRTGWRPPTSSFAPSTSLATARRRSGKLRELWFHLGRDQMRVTYYVASGRRIILLTVFRKTKHRERHEIERAVDAMNRCVKEGHSAEDEL